jgi:signal transduction histidine kinase
LALFGFRGSGEREGEDDPIAALKARLEETGVVPLKRIVTADLPEEARAVADFLNARLDALEAASKEQQQFIADVSHELRTPLTVLRGSLEVVLEEDRPAEEYREAIGNALLEVRHLTRVSQNLLFLVRGESGRITLSFANVDLGRFLTELAQDLAPAAADRGLSLRSEVPEETVLAFVDLDRLRQVFHNLVENALRYTPSGGSVVLRLEVAPGEARMKVIDTGIGIPAEDVPYVFERFFRSDRARRAYSGGSGLGLSIARWIVDAHKGTLSAESEVGKGSVFTVVLPLLT